ncbi:MAG: hypothetical protein FVQ80_07075 [Planctomycetes bacterium]|nr:hypothetical protein [Planctomycetota bacterium]
MELDKGKVEAALLNLGLSTKRSKSIARDLSKMDLAVEGKQEVLRQRAFTTSKSIKEIVKED